ncbi:YHS domain-containing protein [Chryseobacterium nakagawai]|uniref:YHS domain-containing protein n=2 Tax=Chryseobacterium TaxID=59732 RepID=A0AAD0YT65_CHRNA|nr:YHS domain-containing protein [Chryseobacterium nakagawai]
MFASLVYAQQTGRDQKQISKKADLRKVKVINTYDPVCKMKSEDQISDTALYRKRIYGFCSSHCKDRFKQNPEKYLK